MQPELAKPAPEFAASKIPEALIRKATVLHIPGSLVTLCAVSPSDLFWAHDPAISVYVQGDTVGALRMRDSGGLREHRLQRDDICICPEDWTGQLGFSLPSEFMTVRLRARYLEDAFTEGLRGHDLRIGMKRGIQDAQIVNICRALEAEARAGGPSGQLFTGALTTALSVRLLANYTSQGVREPVSSSGLTKRALRLATDYIHAHLSEDIRLEELAGLVRMSPYYFARLFRQSTGLAPHQYVINLRIARAKALLADIGKPIVQIALAIGYSSQSHFTTLFRKATGSTPKQYRDSL